MFVLEALETLFVGKSLKAARRAFLAPVKPFSVVGAEVSFSFTDR